MTDSGKKINRIFKAFTGEKKRYFTSAVIVAAGRGSRMGETAVPKQLMLINGIPVVVHTLLAFERSEYINEIIVVAREEELALYDRFKAEYGLSKLVKAVKGGESRQASVLKGFQAVSESCRFVCIHDGARCLVTDEIIENVCHNAYIHGCAIASVPCSDTLKKEKQGFISGTVDRSTVRAAQTPQVFDADIYRAVAYTAIKDKKLVTDDASLAEAYGFKVRLVDGSSENIKITQPVDLLFAEAILNHRQAGTDGMQEEKR
ncbi:MAG: 2-C-methyl-D-erythritol 4-phosphate cytidylyltransferase [Ruminococcaceae bacterium]|nr:2-C-methyl-D-erythritol 4-phosphate cytidylyltransferase [Oscillospiraceae bacterium]